MSLRAAGAFQRRNFALACAATEAFLGELDPDRVRAVAAEIEIPGRLEQVADDPPVFLDAAHNPDGARALAEALPEAAAGRPVVAVLAILADKDARAMTQALAPALTHAVCTQLPGADGPKIRSICVRNRPVGGLLGLATLAAMCREAGVAAEAEEDFGAAVARGLGAGARAGRGAARRRVALCAGTGAGGVRIGGLMSSKSAGSELLSMMALVAAVVAAVILIFFGLGYLFGNLFL